jgi:GntR family transcriptional regulator, transcriptional repressor for pyruvate dehydrogenase complex
MPEGIAAIDRASRDPVALEVTRRLLDYLLAGGVEPGGRLPPERKLADAFGVGRTVLREALKSLSVLGLVEVRQGDGNYLRSTETEILPKVIEWGLLLGTKTTHDLVEARTIMEKSIVALAAQRIDAAGLADLERLLGEMERANEPTAFLAADVAFHRRIVAATENETLAQIMNNMLSLLRVWISRVMEVEKHYDQIVTQHRAILEALARHDSAAATEAMEAHLGDVFKRLERTIPGAARG